MIAKFPAVGSGAVALALAVIVTPPPLSGGETLTIGASGHYSTGGLVCSPGGRCPYTVRRRADGSGIVTLTKADAQTRSIFFENGQVTGADVEGEGSGKFSASKKGDTTVVQVGEERYEIPDAVLSAK